MGNFIGRIIGAIVSIFVSGDDHVPGASPPPLELRITSVSAATPNIGDTVEVRWEYDSPENLRLQAVQLHCLAFDGRFATQTFGRLPEALLHAGESQPDGAPLEIDQRAIQFRFISPVTFHLIAEDNDGRILQKFIKLMLPDISFSLTVDSGSSLDGLPRLPVPATGARVIRFEKCFGIYEHTHVSGHDPVIENGVVDQLEQDDFRALFSPDAPFFLTSRSASESEHFGSVRGRAMPGLLEDFLVSRGGRQFEGGPVTFADTVIVAMTFAIDGSVETLDANDGKTCDVITSSVIKDIEPVFVQVDFRSKPGDLMHPVICNLHVGNIPQGLVFASFWGTLVNQAAFNTGTPSGIAVEAQPGVPVRTVRGRTDGARIGWDVRKTGTSQVLVPRATFDVAWDGIPVYPDTDLSELFARQFQLP